MNKFVIVYLIISFTLFLSFTKFSKILNIYDKPFGRKIHKQSTSLAGGPFVFISIFSYFLFAIYNNSLIVKIIFINETQFFSFLLICLIFFFIGLIDDRKNLSSSYKTIIFLILIIFHLNLDPMMNIEVLYFLSFEKIILLQNVSLIFSLLCIFIFINALNMYDGSNGQLGLYTLTFIVYLSYKTNSLFLLFLSIPLLLFLILNLQSKTFIGNSGSYFLGFLFSFLIIKIYKFESGFIKADEIILLMFYPIIDLVRLFITRIINNKNPLIGDKEHIHHYLLKKYKQNYKIQIILFSLSSFPLLLYEIFMIKIYFLLLINILIYFFILKKNLKASKDLK